MVRYIIGKDVDKAFRIHLTPPINLLNTSEMCRESDLFTLELIAPYLNDNVVNRTFVAHLYASNSRSNPYVFESDNYWVNLIPTWKFYMEDRKTTVSDIPIVTKKEIIDGQSVMRGVIKFYYVDDIPTTTQKTVKIWVTVDTEKILSTSNSKYEIDETESDDETNVIFPGTTKYTEIIKNGDLEYHPPSYANSTLIAVCSCDINPVRPTKISITRNSKDSISKGIYWSDQIIPFVATVNSDHYSQFRENAKDDLSVTSDVVYNFPVTTALTVTLTGSMKLEYTIDPTTDVKPLIDRYKNFVEEDWDFISNYVPPKEILPTSGTLNSSLYGKNVLENMDYPTFDDLQTKYPDINLNDYFEKICTTCSASGSSASGEPDQNILYVDEYVRLVSQHSDFEYIPYALRIVDTVSHDKNHEIQYKYSTISSYYDNEKLPTFNLLDMTNGYNYKTGGYSFGKVICPNLSGKDYTGDIIAGAHVDSKYNKKTDFHVFKYWVIRDGKCVYAVDDRESYHEDYSEIEEYIRDDVIYQTLPDETIESILEKTTENESFQMRGGFIGVNCVVQDPLYNSWICDADTGYLYKFSIDNQLLCKINLEDEIDLYINLQVKSTAVKNWWRSYKNKGYGISPSNIAINSQNNLYVTMFDFMALVKLDGINGEVLDVYFLPENNIFDDTGIRIDSGWRPAALDIDEYDNVAILFNTSNEENDTLSLDGSEILPHDLRLILFDGEKFIENKKIRIDSSIVNDSTDIFGRLNPAKDPWYLKHMDVNGLLYRTDDRGSYAYFCGSIWRSNGAGTAGDGEVAVLFRLNLNDENAKLEVLSRTISQKGNNGPPIYNHIDYDSMFMDENDTLWFAENKDLTMTDQNRVSSSLKAIVNSRSSDEWRLVEITKLYNDSSNTNNKINFKDVVKGISGITSSSHDELVIVDPVEKKIKKLKYKNRSNPEYGPTDLGYDSKYNIPLTADTGDYEIGALFTRGDWSGMSWVIKYIGSIETLETVLGENQIHLHSYDSRYIRKHHEEWDVAEHMKIPVKNTTFAEDNEVLFKAISETLGRDEHKHYSIGKKLYEGIANQVANIHDIDECHIDSIYSISVKEDVNIDKFIFSYPEELRRISDLNSISRKKLWGNRCHCDQNYFKARTKDTERYCDSCKHIHTSNVGSSIDPMDCSLWNAVVYKMQHNFNITENTWFMLAPVILLVSKIANVIFDPENPITCDVVCPNCKAVNSIAITQDNTEFKCPNCSAINYIKDGIKRMRDCIKPMNQMLSVVQDYVDEYLTPITMSSNTYDVIRMLHLIDDAILSVPNAYIVEDKFNRNEFRRINISRSSYKDAEDILKRINNDKYAIEHGIPPINGYLSVDDYTMMLSGGTNDKIILYVSITNIEDSVLNECNNKISKVTEEVIENIRCAQLLAIHTSFFVPDHWFNYCFWRFIPTKCHNLNTSVINWESKYTTLEEKNYSMRRSWLEDHGMMVQIINYILHNGTLFHRNEEYIDD